MIKFHKQQGEREEGRQVYAQAYLPVLHDWIFPSKNTESHSRPQLFCRSELYTCNYVADLNYSTTNIQPLLLNLS